VGDAHAAAFGVDEYVPASQAAQVRSSVLDGVLLTRVPAGHVVNERQLEASFVVEYDSFGQVVHVRSVDAEPSTDT